MSMDDYQGYTIELRMINIEWMLADGRLQACKLIVHKSKALIQLLKFAYQQRVY